MTCSTCPFYSAFGSSGQSGECRAEPPKSEVIGIEPPTEPGAKPKVGVHTWWPSRLPHHWCGRHPERAHQAAMFANGSMKLLLGDTEAK